MCDQETFVGSVSEYDVMRLQQLCQALDEPFESPDGHGMRRHTWPEVLDLARSRTRAWSTLLRRIEQVDPQWLTEWRGRLIADPRKHPSDTNPTL